VRHVLVAGPRRAASQPARGLHPVRWTGSDQREGHREQPSRAPRAFGADAIRLCCGGATRAAGRSPPAYPFELETAKELKEGNDDVRIVFDGAGTAWVPELAKKDHKAHGLYAAVGDRIAGVCAYCAGAFGVKAAVVAQGVQLASEYEGHPSVRRLVHDGYQVITF
jgi:hypothetical protein